jgi:hypothetical protein
MVRGEVKCPQGRSAARKKLDILDLLQSQSTLDIQNTFATLISSIWDWFEGRSFMGGWSLVDRRRCTSGRSAAFAISVVDLEL